MTATVAIIQTTNVPITLESPRKSGYIQPYQFGLGFVNTFRSNSLSERLVFPMVIL